MRSSSRSFRAGPSRRSGVVVAALLGVALGFGTLTAPAAALPAAERTPGSIATVVPTAKSPRDQFSRDFSGDGITDVLAIRADGALVMYRGAYGESGALQLSSSRVSVIGSGWAPFTAVFSPGDFSGDGFADLLARDKTGGLWLYRGNGKGGWLGKAKVGTGWGPFTALFPAGDFNGDGAVDVFARDASGGLWLYPGNGKGGWLKSAKVGIGWNNFNILVGGVDVNFDGRSDVVGRSGTEERFLGKIRVFPGDDLASYPGTGRGWFGPRTVPLSFGWKNRNAIIPAGQYALVSRDAQGRLWYHELSGNTDFSWNAPVQLGIGWGSLRLVG